MNTLFFALDKISPVGSRPVVVLVGLLLTVGLTWLLTAPQRRHMPTAVARRALQQSLAAALFAGAATYFLLMQLIMPALFAIGVPMGGLFPS